MTHVYNVEKIGSNTSSGSVKPQTLVAFFQVLLDLSLLKKTAIYLLGRLWNWDDAQRIPVRQVLLREHTQISIR